MNSLPSVSMHNTCFKKLNKYSGLAGWIANNADIMVILYYSVQLLLSWHYLALLWDVVFVVRVVFGVLAAPPATKRPSNVGLQE